MVETAPHPTDLGNQLAALMDGYKKYFPNRLAEVFPRIIKRIVELWDLPEMERRYFKDLLLVEPGRQGFPKDIASEINKLSLVYEAINPIPKLNEKDVWAHVREKAIAELNLLGIAFTKRNFFNCVIEGRVREIALFLQAGMDIEILDDQGWTPLMRASFNSSEEAATLLIEMGANVLVHDVNGYTPMHWSAQNGYSRMLRILKSKGADPDTHSFTGITPLMQAAVNGHADAVQQLINMNALVDGATTTRLTALHKAVANRHYEVVKILVENRANRNFSTDNGVTPISIAAEKGLYDKKFRDILKLLDKDMAERVEEEAEMLATQRTKDKKKSGGLVKKLLAYVGLK
ncbi:ankyrin repeat domain-containing protein [Methylovulum miyakonense]|uniref:ankyrin repeat domain-containing protein n=1 Tax=Methylovulum miyakonense TaxID=645578 RepID=UPI0003708F1B|nr:ankyrin repeat domain-containing protein [Methylovulum miyakonense]